MIGTAFKSTHSGREKRDKYPNGVQGITLRPILVLLAGLFLSLSLPFSALALTADGIQAISFGTIIADPSHHETFEIDARFGPASTVRTSTGVSVISNAGRNGIIRVSSGLAFSCSLLFPASITLSGGGDTMVVDRFSVLSETGGSIPGSGVLDLSVGGRLQVKRGQSPASYSGSAIIMVIIE